MQSDEKLQYPILSNLAEEVWKTKEAKLPTADEPHLGEAKTRGINLECITAVSALQAGADLIILRHPETLNHLRKYVSGLMVETSLDGLDVDMSLAPEAAAAPAKAAPAKAAPAAKPALKPVPAAKPAPPKEEAKAPEKVEPAPKPELKVVPDKPAPAPKPVPVSAAGEVDLSEVDFSEDEIQAIREILNTYKAIRGIVKLVSKF